MFTIKEILEATGGKLVSGPLNQQVSAVSTDSRTIRPKELFVALCGKRFDGHNFIHQAKRSGARAILLSKPRYETKKLSGSLSLIRVKDTLKALGDLACYHRAKFSVPIVAITGSNGKTTTKEMLSKIAQQRFKLLRNPGTENNLIGVPLALFRLTDRHNLVVMEIGANHPGEIERLTEILQPTIGIITNIGPSHLEFFKNLPGVLRAKLEMLKYLDKNGTLIINKDDRLLSKLNGINLRTITFGFDRRADFYAQDVKEDEDKLSFSLNRSQRIALKALGRHNLYNALASIACARCLGIGFGEIKQGLLSFQMPPLRMQMFKSKRIKIINDCYNANPASFRWALEFLKGYFAPGRKILVCGDMLELGKEAKKLHWDIGQMLAKDKIDYLITVGGLAKNIALSAHQAGMSVKAIQKCRDSLTAGKLLRKFLIPGDLVLIKGSRAMQMEKAVECFTNSSTH